MKYASKSINLFRFMPGADMFLLLFVLIFGTAGISWVTASPAASSSEKASLSASSEEKHKQLADLLNEIESLRREIEHKQAEANQLQAALDKTEADSSDLDDTRIKHAQSRHNLEKLRRRLSDLENALRNLQQKASELLHKKQWQEQLKKAFDEIKKQLRQLAAQLDQLMQANRTLQNDIDEMNATPIDRHEVRIDFYPIFKTQKNRKPLLVVLAEGKVTPMREPYYTPSNLPEMQLWTRVRHAETVDRALAHGSEFLKLIEKLDRNREYVFLAVDSSSFETFRKVRKTLQQYEVPFGWNPYKKTEYFAFVSQGGTEPGTIE